MSSTSNRKNSNSGRSPDDEWIGELIWTLVKAAGHLLWWAILFPAISVPIIACTAHCHASLVPRAFRSASHRCRPSVVLLPTLLHSSSAYKQGAELCGVSRAR